MSTDGVPACWLLQSAAIAVATPRRLLDLLASEHIHLKDLDMAVFDECDALLSQERRRIQRTVQPSATPTGKGKGRGKGKVQYAPPTYIDEETTALLKRLSNLRRRRHEATTKASKDTAVSDVPRASPQLCFVAATCSEEVRDRLDSVATSYLAGTRDAPSHKNNAEQAGKRGKRRNKDRFIQWIDGEDRPENFGILPEGIELLPLSCCH